METKKIYINENNEGNFVCKLCGFSKIFDATKFINSKKSVKVVCKCGGLNRFTLEFRKFYRKDLNIIGKVDFKNKKITKTFLINIRNISQTGIGFIVLKKDFTSLLNLNDKLTITFKLNSTKRTIEIVKECIVKFIENDNIGVEFSDINYQKEIGFFLMN